MSLERLGLPFLRRIDPERAHGLALAALRAGLGAAPGPVSSPRLRCELTGMALPNPLGLAAGFDKNAVAGKALMRAGFGWLEFGAATPRAQPGNPRPRLFRLPEDRAAINRFGFNNDGAEAIAERLRALPPGLPRGINLGANKDSADRAADFARVLSVTGPHCDFATVNVSSPNTEKLRDLQGAEALAALLEGVMAANAGLPRPLPVFLKIAPDLSESELEALAEAALAAGVAGIVSSNTTLSREGLRGAAKDQAGGLSGRPLFRRATRQLALLSVLTGGRVPLIGVGGIEDAETALAKIEAGASALQLYTALAYEGLGLVPRLLRDLDTLMAARGYGSLAEAVGAKRGDWL